MNKIELNNVIIELTRKCNMACSHCLRGDAQNIDIKKEYITNLLENIKYISIVSFSGGEPSLNIGAIKYFIEEAKRLNVDVGNFYIATNGKKITDEFILTIIELHLFCSENEISVVEGSNDYYHIEDSKQNYNKLKCLSFFKLRDEKDGEKRFMINEGRYKENYGDGRELTIYQLTIEDNRVDGEFYLNVNGDIIRSCNLSYENQEHNIVGHVRKFNEIRFKKEN